ncbi:MAG: nuclear transport factor 2 family protein [Gammaproteobacteria bacterium]|nr:nuclear transport factor 2 family protein [Gammaproteobacteria bacterium]
MKALYSTFLIIALGAAGSLQAAAPGPAEVVKTFNSAVTERDMDTAMEQLADGGVVLQLRPAHPGMPENPPLTGDLIKTWQVVGAILFPSTEAYSRKPEITSVTEHGDIATVWADTTTTTHRKNVSDPMVLNFSEMYVLVKKSGQWKIAVIGDNRQPDTIVVGDS